MAYDDDPPMPVEPPPQGVRRWRVSAWCGAIGHAREIIEAKNPADLSRTSQAWRCPQCGRPDLFTKH